MRNDIDMSLQFGSIAYSAIIIDSKPPIFATELPIAYAISDAVGPW